jgi:hypothetical protein
LLLIAQAELRTTRTRRQTKRPDYYNFGDDDEQVCPKCPHRKPYVDQHSALSRTRTAHIMNSLMATPDPTMRMMPPPLTVAVGGLVVRLDARPTTPIRLLNGEANGAPRDWATRTSTMVLRQSGHGRRIA